METLFIESNEDIGILYHSYKHIPTKIKSFLDVLDWFVNNLDQQGLADEEDYQNLLTDLSKFKSDITMNEHSEPVRMSKIKELKNAISDAKDDMMECLNFLAKIKHQARFGNNLVNGIINKPKIISGTIDSERLDRGNKEIRLVNRCMDWAEKYILDVLNLIEQDLNLLLVVDKVYIGNIYESYLMMEDEEDILDKDIEPKSTTYDSAITGETDPEEDRDILNMQYKDENETYYPVFAIIVSYDRSLWSTATSEQRACMRNGLLISTVTNGDAYTHTIVTFDTSLEHLFHYNGSGFYEDSIYKNVSFEITKSIYINVTFVTQEERDKINHTINDFLRHKEETSYGPSYLINQLLGRTKNSDRKQICSTFVAWLLAKADVKNLHRDYSLIRPEDITLFPRSFYVMTFRNLDDFKERKHELQDRVDRIYKENIEEIREYNNILPRIVIKDQLAKQRTPEGVINWYAKRLLNDSSPE